MITYNKIHNNKIQQNANNKINTNINQKISFEEILKKKESAKSLTFSKHATERLNQRDIKLSTQDIKKMDEALEKAAKKGIKETLILMENRAFIANVKNKTIITAAVEEQLKDSVFTNIDGTVII
ncbi:TIGR02530 family flagellar biosynthesis protein [Serpentinicella sp. ANB-PHB4]|uniref:TIGR02530 family flagellar biosynthesis protein n=1 Tax=Serpentinicella sp. ANB-PHB4 TaxID=3074076 RepID=UPI002863D245|nr:TIGR02530 family flagellar biosynthesis protein [Serpentinicella sp. ANB-PHB4]MDR5658264.1 TIGR02530 family flagellar biosynthesis protein [Serpentinicella sp. ANB-PHB4]